MSPHHEGGAITYTEKGNKAYGHILGDHENIFLEQWILKKIFQGMFCTHRSSYSWKLIIIWNYGLSVIVASPRLISTYQIKINGQSTSSAIFHWSRRTYYVS